MWAMTLRIFLTLANAWTAFPTCTWSLVRELGSWDASRVWPESSSRNTRIEFFLERMPSPMERTRLSKFSWMNFTRFTTAFLKPKTNTSIMHQHLHLLRDAGDAMAWDCRTEYYRRFIKKLPHGYCT